jgi:hypothetical protein
MSWPLVGLILGLVAIFVFRSGAGGSRVFERSKHRLFKITATGDKGRAVSRPARGHFIVIAPRALIRDEVTID